MAHNGCCLTVTAVEGNRVSFDLIKETLRLTNLGDLALGDIVNIERAAKFNDEIGGHLMSGHIICTAEVAKIYTSENNRRMAAHAECGIDEICAAQRFHRHRRH